jgi:DNA-binding NarL/FixJ family response regulator
MAYEEHSPGLGPDRIAEHVRRVVEGFNSVAHVAATAVAHHAQVSPEGPPEIASQSPAPHASASTNSLQGELSPEPEEPEVRRRYAPGQIREVLRFLHTGLGKRSKREIDMYALLSPRKAEIVRRLVETDLQVTSIAEQMNINETTVSHRAHDAIEDILRNADPDDLPERLPEPKGGVIVDRLHWGAETEETVGNELLRQWKPDQFRPLLRYLNDQLSGKADIYALVPPRHRKVVAMLVNTDNSIETASKLLGIGIKAVETMAQLSLDNILQRTRPEHLPELLPESGGPALNTLGLTVGQELNLIREALEIPREELAVAFDLSLSTLTRFFNSHAYSPATNILIPVMRELGLPPLTTERLLKKYRTERKEHFEKNK